MMMKNPTYVTRSSLTSTTIPRCKKNSQHQRQQKSNTHTKKNFVKLVLLLLRFQFLLPFRGILDKKKNPPNQNTFTIEKICCFDYKCSLGVLFMFFFSGFDLSYSLHCARARTTMIAITIVQTQEEAERYSAHDTQCV